MLMPYVSSMLSLASSAGIRGSMLRISQSVRRVGLWVFLIFMWSSSLLNLVSLKILASAW